MVKQLKQMFKRKISFIRFSKKLRTKGKKFFTFLLLAEWKSWIFPYISKILCEYWATLHTTEYVNWNTINNEVLGILFYDRNEYNVVFSLSSYSIKVLVTGCIDISTLHNNLLSSKVFYSS